MKTNECTIYIMFKDEWIQKFRKEDDGWKLYSRNLTMRPCTAEQFISHLLPPLAGIKGPNVTVKVIPDKQIKDKKVEGLREEINELKPVLEKINLNDIVKSTREDRDNPVK